MLHEIPVCMQLMQEQDKKTSALRKLNASLLKDKRIRLSIVPIGDGMALCTKL